MPLRRKLYLAVPVSVNGVDLRAQVDTGADASMISRDVVGRFSPPLTVVGECWTETLDADPIKANPVYTVTLDLFGNRFPAVDIVATRLPTACLSYGCEVLLGMDVIEHCRLELDGPAGTFTLAPQRVPERIAFLRDNWVDDSGEVA